MTSSREEREEEKVIITWQTTMKPSIYDLRELPAVRKSASPAGTGYVYYCSHDNTWQKPRSIDVLPPKQQNKRIREERSR